MKNQNHSVKASIQKGLNAAKDNAFAGFILWLFALGLVLSYYFLPFLQPFYTFIGNLKTKGGFYYSLIATSIFGGLIPFIIRLIKNPKSFNIKPIFAGIFFLVFWAVKGIEVDLLYKLQDLIFGKGLGFKVIAKKVAFDQFVYGPVWAVWTQALAYLWMENNFSIKNLKNNLTFKGFFWQSFTILISSLTIWIPMVSVIYSMPSNLQIPLFNIVLCFWGLMLGSMNKN